jgi:uncharacterized protein YqgC (DUF456 family)
MMDWLWVMLYLVLVWVGVLICLLGFPGPLLITGASALAGWSTGWQVVHIWLVLVFFVLALLAEILDQWLAVASARSYGSTRAGMWGSFLGGLAGALLGIPVPFVGSLCGAFLGAFAGAFILELLISKKKFFPAAQAGYGAFRGRIGAAIFKTVLALSMAVTASLTVLTAIS